MSDRRRFLRAARIGGGLFVATIMGAIGLHVFLQTRPGLDFLAERIGRAVSDETMVAHLTRLEGSITSSFRVEKITVADRDGVYAVVDDARLDWRPLALFGRTLDIATLTIGRLEIFRPPTSEPVSEPTLFERLVSALHLRVEEVAIEEVALAPPVLGQEQRLSAAASVRRAADLSKVALNLILRRVDGGRDKAEIKLDYAAHPARFVAQIHVEEPAGGVLARLAGLPRGERLSVDLSGDGPPDAWHGMLKIEAGTDTAVHSAVAVALRGNAVGVSMDGTAKIANLLPAQVRPLLAPLMRFRTDADFVASEGISIKNISAESDLLTAMGSGRYGTADRQISATIAVESRDRPLPAAMLPDFSIGPGRVEAKLEGTLEAPHLRLSFQTDRVTRRSLRMASVTGSIALTPVSATSFDLQGSVKAGGFDPGEAIPAGLLGQTLDVTVTGRVDRDATLPRVTVVAASGPAKVELSGGLDRDGLGVGVYSLRLDRIATAARSAGLALKGNLHAEGTFRADLPSRSLRLTTKGALAGLAGASPGVGALFGERVAFAGAIDWRDGGPMKIVGLELNPAIGLINADGAVDIETGRLSAKVNAVIPTLETLSALAGTQLAGRATITGTLDGRFAALTARGQAFVTDLEIEKFAIGRVGIGYAARREGAALVTALRLGGDFRGKQLDGRLNAHFQEGAIRLSEIDIGVGANRIAGTLDLDRARARLAGAVTARLNALADLPGAERLGLAGSGEIRVVTNTGDAREIDLAAVARDVRIGSGAAGGATIEKATARLRLRDPFADATADGELADGELNIENAQVAGLRRGRAHVRIRGNSSKIDWSTDAAADAAYPVSLSAGGTATLADAGSRVSLERLEGKIAEHAVGLRAPFAVTWRAGAWRAEPVDLSIAGGRFRLAGSLAGGALDATGELDGLPLRFVALIDPRFQIDGSVAGKLSVSGTPRRPVLSASLLARDIRPLGMGKEKFAGFNLTLDLHQNSDAADAIAKLAGPDETHATAAVKTLPLFTLDPFSIALESDLPLAGELTANGRLDLINELAGLGEDRMAGHIAARAKIAGTLGRPDIQGDARLSGGSYEGAMTGSVLRNIKAQVRFSGDSAQLASLTADDGGTGRLSGKGAVRFAGAGASLDGMEITLDRFTALRHPLAEAVASGGLILSGSFEAPRITGRLRIDRANIGIPDQLPEEIIELDVIEINNQRTDAAKASIPKEPSLIKSLPVPLDLTLDLPRRTFLRGRGLDSEWQGNLVVSGTASAPLIKGKLQAVRGTFAFAGKTFVVKSGSIFFPSSTVAEPEIEAIAEAKLKDLLARVKIAGSVSKPTITVSSEPALPQEDVLAHILFGRTTGQLSAIQAVQLAQTAATLSGKGGSTGIVDKVRQALGVDVLNVESEEGSGRGASLKAGKYLTEEIFLSVSQGTQPDSQKVGVEVEVLPNVTVESDISGSADSNIGLNWKWDY